MWPVHETLKAWASYQFVKNVTYSLARSVQVKANKIKEQDAMMWYDMIWLGEVRCLRLYEIRDSRFQVQGLRFEVRGVVQYHLNQWFPSQFDVRCSTFYFLRSTFGVRRSMMLWAPDTDASIIHSFKQYSSDPGTYFISFFRSILLLS